MRSSFAKSIYVGAAVLGLAGLSAVTTTTASAKSSAVKVTSSKALTTDATTRNVTFTGTNALYSKPGTVKGAKVVATTTTVKRLAASKNGQDNVRAYRVATTNRGSVYYKVVTFDGAYRGWIYGGKATDKFAGGINSFATTTEAKVPSTLNTTSYYTLAKTDASVNDGTTTTYKAPAWSQYKVGRTMKDASAYKSDLLQVSKAATTREGDTWVYVTDVTSGKLTGWVKASALKASSDVPASEGVTINYTNKATGEIVSRQVLPFKADNALLAKQTMNVTKADISVPKGYSALPDVQSWGSVADAQAATKGSALVYYVTANAKTTQVPVKLVNVATPTDSKDSLYKKLNASQKDALTKATKDAANQVVSGTDVSDSTVSAIITEAGLKSFTYKDGDSTYTATLSTVKGATTTANAKTANPSYAYYNVTKN